MLVVLLLLVVGIEAWIGKSNNESTNAQNAAVAQAYLDGQTHAYRYPPPGRVVLIQNQDAKVIAKWTGHEWVKGR